MPNRPQTGRVACLLFASLVLLLFIPKAHADEPSLFRPGVLTFNVQPSLGGPLGFLGLSVDYALTAGWSLDVGAGWTPSGWHFGASTRYRFKQSGTFSFGPELIFSLGPYEHDTRPPLAIFGAPGYEQEWDRAAWLGGGVFYEKRIGRFHYRIYGGYARTVNPADSCIRHVPRATSPRVRGLFGATTMRASCDGDAPSGQLGYFGFSFGYALDLW